MASIALLLGSFHKGLVERMAERARARAKEHGLTILREVWVPGSLEKPLAAKRLLAQPEIDGLVVLGIIERGETKHGLVMGEVVLSALVQLQLEWNKPMGIGILGPEILPHQIPPRLYPYAEKAVDALASMLSWS